MCVAGDHEVDPGGKLRVGRIRIMREDNSTVGIRNPSQDLVQVPMVLPQVTGPCQPKPVPILFDDLRLVPEILITVVQPLLRSPRVGPMTVVSEYRMHAKWSLQLRKNWPNPVNL